jgi:hypothetical protein
MTVLDFSTYDDIPYHTQYELSAWVEKGYFPGSFLTAVLCNDLFAAVGSADALNIKALQAITTFVYNRVPTDAWGSAEEMRAYAKKVWYANETV